MKKIVKTITFVMLCVICLVPVGCSKPTDSEVLSAYKELYPKAFELYKIMYAEGLPYDGEYDKDTLTSPYYVEVSDTSPYKTKAELEEAVLSVYSQTYYDSTLKMVLFNGSEADEYGMLGVSPRYKETAGKLYVDITFGQFASNECDLSTAKVKEIKRRSAVITVSYTYNGEAKSKNTQMVLTENGWRFDGLV